MFFYVNMKSYFITYLWIWTSEQSYEVDVPSIL